MVTTVEHTVVMRPIHCELDILSESDGSAMLTQGETAILSSVNGPVEVKLSNLQYDKASVEVNYRPRTGLPQVADRFKEHLIRGTCESALIPTLYPRTAISIQLQEMEDNGGLLACCINASCLALMNAGLAMKCTVAAVRCVISEPGNKILVDPSAKDVAGGDGQMEARAEFTFVFDSVEKKAVSCHCTGRYSPEEFQEAMAAAKTASQEVFEFYRASLRRFTKIL